MDKKSHKNETKVALGNLDNRKRCHDEGHTEIADRLQHLLLLSVSP